VSSEHALDESVVSWMIPFLNNQLANEIQAFQQGTTKPYYYYYYYLCPCSYSYSAVSQNQGLRAWQLGSWRNASLMRQGDLLLMLEAAPFRLNLSALGPCGSPNRSPLKG